MGWLSSRALLSQSYAGSTTDTKFSSIHVEDVSPRPKQQESNTEYPFQSPSVPDEALPFIPPSIVREARTESPETTRVWIVVDNVVYDCTNFINEHPGGDTFIRSFVGEDCSWQFWRFHTRNTMRDYGKPLRIGRTEGIANRFKEPPRYVGSL